MHYNAALSSYLCILSINEKCVDYYRSFGDVINGEEFCDLIILLKNKIMLSTDAIFKHIFKNVPKITTKTH